MCVCVCVCVYVCLRVRFGSTFIGIRTIEKISRAHEFVKRSIFLGGAHSVMVIIL